MYRDGDVEEGIDILREGAAHRVASCMISLAEIFESKNEHILAASCYQTFQEIAPSEGVQKRLEALPLRARELGLAASKAREVFDVPSASSAEEMCQILKTWIYDPFGVFHARCTVEKATKRGEVAALSLYPTKEDSNGEDLLLVASHEGEMEVIYKLGHGTHTDVDTYIGDVKVLKLERRQLIPRGLDEILVEAEQRELFYSGCLDSKLVNRGLTLCAHEKSGWSCVTAPIGEWTELDPVGACSSAVPPGVVFDLGYRFSSGKVTFFKRRGTLPVADLLFHGSYPIKDFIASHEEYLSPLCHKNHLPVDDSR